MGVFAGLQFPPALPLMSVDRPFYRYSGHIELIRIKEYYGMPRGGISIFPFGDIVVQGLERCVSDV